MSQSKLSISVPFFPKYMEWLKISIKDIEFFNWFYLYIAIYPDNINRDHGPGKNMLGSPWPSHRARHVVSGTPTLPTRHGFDGRRFVSEQNLHSPETTELSTPMESKGAVFENKIRAERPNNKLYTLVEVTLPIEKLMWAESAKCHTTPPVTPKPPRRAFPEQKRLLSQRVIFLNDQSSNTCSSRKFIAQ